jgi:hypothetical protein
MVSSLDECGRHQRRSDNVNHTGGLHRIVSIRRVTRVRKGEGEYHGENRGDGGTESGAESEETGEEGEDCKGEGNQEEGKHESRCVVVKVLIQRKVFGDRTGTIEVLRGIKWISRRMFSTIDIFPIRCGSTNSPESPLSKPWGTISTGYKLEVLLPEGEFMPVLKEEMSAERKNVSLRGTESFTPARITKNNRTTAPINTQSQSWSQMSKKIPACNMNGTHTNALVAILKILFDNQRSIR